MEQKEQSLQNERRNTDRSLVEEREKTNLSITKNSKIILSTESSNAFLTVSIRDEGPGIPKEKTTEIFEKFTQLKSKDRTGLGLGLHISKMLIEAHDGKLWVESQFGTGSTFSFRLPITK